MKFESGWYMASTLNINRCYDYTLGDIESLSTKNIRTKRIKRNVVWCLDNGVFTGKFEKQRWLDFMEKYSLYINTCLFVVIPDVVADFKATVDSFHYYRKMVTDYPVAFVSQDGISEFPEMIPWNDFDCIFIGGSDKHKLGYEGGWVISEAKKHNKWIHVGRVNSVKRMLKFWQADSFDGTHLSFFPSDQHKFHNAILLLRQMKKQRSLFDGLHYNVFNSNSIG